MYICNYVACAIYTDQDTMICNIHKLVPEWFYVPGQQVTPLPVNFQTTVLLILRPQLYWEESPNLI